MSVVRRFLVAPSLVRLIRKERGGSRVTEGFFPSQGGRTSYVRVEGNQCQLVLVTTGQGQLASEERTDVPRAHGDALLDVCAGKAAYDRTAVNLGSIEAQVDRYLTPVGLDTVCVTFETSDAAQGFAVPAWFGNEVTNDGAYEPRGIALQGVPTPGEIPLTNTALEAVLDLFDHRFGLGGRYGSSNRSAGQESSGNALRRLAGSPAETAAPASAPAPKAPPEVSAAPAPVPPPAAPDVHLPVADLPGEEDRRNDARIDDVIESLSQALGASIPQAKEPAGGEEGVAPFERWTVRSRRSQQT